MSEIDERVRSFLADHITSIEQLELLLLLRSTSDQEWSADECSRALGSDLRWTHELLDELTARGFLVARESERVSKHRYGPSTEEARALVDGAAKAYKERRLSVIELIHGGLESE